MSTDHLTAPAVAPGSTVARLADAVVAVLSGTPLDVAARAITTSPADLADAVELYQRAGHQALDDHAAQDGWQQINVTFPGSAEAAGAALRRSLHDLVDGWWFMRKRPGLRLRLRPRADAGQTIETALTNLAASGVISGWQPVIYESETAAFGGPTGMAIAHELFCADSGHILTRLPQPAQEVGRKELSMLLLGTMLSTCLDRFERGDVWQLVAEQRPLPAPPPTAKLEALAERILPLVASPLNATAPAGPLAFAAPWADAFSRAGQSLYEAAAAGQLTRGLRRVLVHHVIFHWNRIGLPATTQGVLSRAAREALLPAGTRP